MSINKNIFPDGALPDVTSPGPACVSLDLEGLCESGLSFNAEPTVGQAKVSQDVVVVQGAKENRTLGDVRMDQINTQFCPELAAIEKIKINNEWMPISVALGKHLPELKAAIQKSASIENPGVVLAQIKQWEAYETEAQGMIAQMEARKASENSTTYAQNQAATPPTLRT